MDFRIETITRPLAEPFSITGYTFTDLHAVWVTLTDGEFSGRGEGVGMYYRGETPESMSAELEGVREALGRGASRADIQSLLPPGGARNALDCAMWDLECKSRGESIWEVLGITPRPVVTVATLGMDSPAEMARKARDFAAYPHLKVKLSEDDPMGKLWAIREARPDAELVVDVNQGWSFGELVAYLPELEALGVAFVEQPLPRGEDAELEGFRSPIPLGADESLVDLADYPEAASKYDVINIKLDKCGGLTEALAIVEAAKKDGKDVMVGNMTGTSLGMAPSHVIAQFSRFVDIDGPLLLASDIEGGLEYHPGGIVDPPLPALWG